MNERHSQKLPAQSGTVRHDKQEAALPTELLTVLSARALEGRSIVFAGFGLPTLAVALAQRTVSPDAEIVYESGVTGARPADMPRSVSDSILVPGSSGVLPMAQLFNYVLQGERIEVGFLGAAQIDKYGSLNSTLIGRDWDKPRTKLPGSGGAIEVMANAAEVYVVMRRHTSATFVEELDYCTSPSPHRAARSSGGSMPTGRGVTKVITDMGILTRTERDEELTLTEIHPGISVAKVRAATGWDVKIAENLKVTSLPTREELHLLRDELDPERVYLR